MLKRLEVEKRIIKENLVVGRKLRSIYINDIALYIDMNMAFSMSFMRRMLDFIPGRRLVSMNMKHNQVVSHKPVYLEKYDGSYYAVDLYDLSAGKHKIRCGDESACTVNPAYIQDEYCDGELNYKSYAGKQLAYLVESILYDLGIKFGKINVLFENPMEVKIDVIWINGNTKDVIHQLFTLLLPFLKGMHVYLSVTHKYGSGHLVEQYL